MSETLIKASHHMDKLIADIARVEQERDEARRHLQEIVGAWEFATNDGIEDAIQHASFYLKGGI